MKVYFTTIILLFIVSTSFLFSQFEEKKPSLIDKKEALIPSTPQQSIPLEETIDASEYIVGPSDGFNVSVWISPPLSFSLTVTPEGTLIIPTVGEIKITDEFLKDAKSDIIDAIRKKYIQGEISATLISPRPIVVHIDGAIFLPGTYTARSIDRADKIIKQASELSTTMVTFDKEEDQKKLLEEQSTRNIILRRRDGTQLHVDILKFYATKRNMLNPYLREGDVIVVPRNEKERNVIGIYGEVNIPGRYEFVEGDSISSLIDIAHGFTLRANSDSIEFSRMDAEGKTISSQVISKDGIESQQQNFLLQPGDRIIVKSKMDLRQDFIVEIKGEVRYPGKYPITKDRTTLSTIINQAGGFTEFASLKTAEVIRNSVKKEEIETERLLSFRGNVSAEDSSYYSLEASLRMKKEAVTVDFEKLFHDGDSTKDITLRSEDEIVIPTIQIGRAHV